jgi:hypothetical protein
VLVPESAAPADFTGCAHFASFIGIFGLLKPEEFKSGRTRVQRPVRSFPVGRALGLAEKGIQPPI